jgi:hypothetical protein
VVPLIDVSKDEITNFNVIIAVACMKKSNERIELEDIAEGLNPRQYAVPDYFYRKKDDSLVVGFDGKWYPFLESTRGYNHDYERWYLPDTKSRCLLDRVADLMRASGQKIGGKVFLYSTGARWCPTSTNEVELLRWSLSNKSWYLRDRG